MKFYFNKSMLKTKYINIPIFFLVFVLFFIFYSLLTTHYSLVYAQSSDTQKAVETVKEKVETLIEAKDENNLDNLNLKISALKKVIELSISEAKDLRIKILSVDLSEDKTNQKSMSKWLEKVLASLNATISYYEKQTLNLENDDEISDAETIKVLAENLKNWREKNYLPLDNEVRDLLLTIQETKAIAVTKNRAQKINEDVLKFQKNRGKNASLNKLMETAFKSINESEKFNEKAKNLFLETYIYTIANSIISSSTEIFSSTTTEI